ncbi:MAG: PTS sugar transporter subunit IIA [Paeniclostridium sordellii]|uniref:PTS sugar transporter subunit IIA n=1 Tax=Paeniclostridium hominis TaxID=2764329 RepID=A0ABR7K4Q7_9FIRM|nr:MULTISPECIES: PTS sugar transporter subunit IIA [Paeniclostridium]MBC6004050.1 PTS sugar transporter subunit IIA [Paeniclostridium hominis]MDU1538718.1 PTS sugar transporter subunit IIA [Paeniclostridium sordellii]MDU2591768.1 PTS sugar transporter subunit IIA [Paeniclostridium sordellii]
MIIITGHGNFASGLKSSLDLIVGNYDFIKVVDFTENKNPEELKNDIKSIIDKCSDNELYIFTDLAGGTPFKVSSELAFNNNIKVFCGTNLPMLIEASMMVSLGCDIDVNFIKETGINAINPQKKVVEFKDEGI